MFDEVITGFRVGHGGAQGRYGITPDLSIFGKVIGGGLPLAAVGGRAEIMDRLAPLGPVYQAGTLSGNPLATAAGLAVLAQLDWDAYATLEATATTLADGLRRALSGAGLPAQVGFPDSVPAWYTGPSGASSSITAARPPTAASGRPPPTTLPKIERSGVMPKRACAPPTPTRKPVMTSSNTSSAPCRVQRSRSPSRKPAAGGTSPMLAAIGSTRIAATSAPCSASAASSAARSL